MRNIIVVKNITFRLVLRINVVHCQTLRAYFAEFALLKTLGLLHKLVFCYIMLI
jgi:hypothetical protein